MGRYDSDQKALRMQIVEIMWYMRGSLSRDAAWTLSPLERSEIVEFIGERIKIVKETNLPLL